MSVVPVVPRHLQGAKQAVERVVAGGQVRGQAGREVQRVLGAGGAAIAERQPPQVRDGDRLALAFFSSPTKWPFLGLKALMVPSPKLPTSRSLLKLPKFEGAIATAHG